MNAISFDIFPRQVYQEVEQCKSTETANVVQVERRRRKEYLLAEYLPTGRIENEKTFQQNFHEMIAVSEDRAE